MTPTSRTPRTAPLYSLRAIAFALLLMLALTPFTAASAHPSPGHDDEDPALHQHVSADEKEVKGEPAVIDHGHVDMGPRLRDGRFMLQARDDSAATPVWRDLDDVVFRVSDKGMVSLPEGDEYAFTHAKQGQSVHAIPQTEIPGVVWMGWSTQDPPMTKAVSRGVTLTLVDVQGPGDFTLFLQPGNFGPPQLLWDGSSPQPRDIWVDLNTHTHATWVFTKPGVYLLEVKVSAEGTDGSTLTDTRTLRFAVGDGTSVEEARSAQWQKGRGPAAESTPTPQHSSTARPDALARSEQAASSHQTLLIGVLIAAGVAVILAVVLVASARRSRRLEKQVFTGTGSETDRVGDDRPDTPAPGSEDRR